MKKIKILFMMALTAANFMAQDGINFSADTINGEFITVSELQKNGPVLVNFWALWCKPCRTEMKALKALYEKYLKNGFQIIAVNEDTPRSVAKVESFVKSQGLDFYVVLDPNKELFERFNGQAIPYTLLYDQSGNVVYQNTGYLPGDEIKLEEELVKLFEGKN